MTCIRCNQPKRADEMLAGRRHCLDCQRRAARLSYYRHRFVCLEKVNRRRAEQYGCSIELVDYAAIYFAQIGQACALCGQPTSPDNAEFDHIAPLADGGAHADQNIRIIHRTCNREASMRRFVLARVLTRRI
jgi:5-methylcytosine-specific restriction endonuclease McrA